MTKLGGQSWLPSLPNAGAFPVKCCSGCSDFGAALNAKLKPSNLLLLQSAEAFNRSVNSASSTGDSRMKAGIPPARVMPQK